ncbi:MAG: hypothetical protein V7711_01270 [Pseudomonadales bacterium]
MKKYCISLALAVGLVIAPLAVLAAMSSEDASRTVRQMEQDALSADAIIQFLLDNGFELEDSAAIGVAAATSETYRLTLTHAAICMAEGEAQARDVRTAAVGAAGDSADAVTGEGNRTVDLFIENGCADDPQDVGGYQEQPAALTTSGGSVSPST